MKRGAFHSFVFLQYNFGWCHFYNKFLVSLRKERKNKDSNILKAFGAWFSAFCAGQGRQRCSSQEANRTSPNPSVPGGGVTVLGLYFPLAGMKL